MNWPAELRGSERLQELEPASRWRTCVVPLLRGPGGAGGQSPRQPPHCRIYAIDWNSTGGCHGACFSTATTQTHSAEASASLVVGSCRVCRRCPTPYVLCVSQKW